MRDSVALFSRFHVSQYIDTHIPSPEAERGPLRQLVAQHHTELGLSWIQLEVRCYGRASLPCPLSWQAGRG